jgi:penicillin-binding protein 1C
MTPKTIMTDVAINYAGYVPENYDQKFNGYVSMEYASDHSLNIPAVKSLKLLGKDKLVQTLAQCGFKQIAKDQNKLGLSMILGGCGCSLEEMTGLFSALANEGEYVSPLYTAADTISQKHVQVLSKASAFMITEILSKINRPDFPMSWTSTIHLPKIAWKTGTSYGRRDAWSIGYNKKYTVGVWLGNFSGTGIPELSGANVATPLLFKLFNTLDYDADHSWYSPPATCQQRMVCSETGLLPGEHCTNIINDYFIPLISSNAICNNTQEIYVTPDDKWSYKKECLPATGYKKKLIKLVPPEMQQYFDDNKIKYEKIPPLSPDCANATAGNAPFINAPVNGSDYFISKNNPEPLALSCQSAADVNKIFWYINYQFYKSCNPKEKLFFMPTEGPIKISCTDDKGRNRDVWIKVKFVDL